jgi:hypothetical protein
MPSSYTVSARFNLQATGENNNTWGVILNSGVFQLVDDTINGRIGFALSGAKTLTVNNGATDEARMRFIDVTGGSGGVITIPSVAKGYFVRNASAGVVGLTAGGATLNFNPGDAGPVHTDGTTIYPVLIGGLSIKAYVDQGDLAQKNYTDAQIAGAVIVNPPITGHPNTVLCTDGATTFWSQVTATQIAPGAVGNTQLAVGAAVANIGYQPVKTVNEVPVDAANNVAASMFRNRVMNGDMRIVQRRAKGAGYTPASSGYTADRWNFFITAASKMTVNPTNGIPANGANGFADYLMLQTASAYAVAATDLLALYQPIEGYNIADLLWGTANAKPVTLSFWAYSSLTGTFGGFVKNGNSTRAYPFNYNIGVANTWTQITINVPGDAIGTWTVDNTVGVAVGFGLGVGSNFQGPANAWGGGNYNSPPGCVSVVGTLSAIFAVTGVQFEVGAARSTFERRPFEVELLRCQRFCEKSYDLSVLPGAATQNGRTLISRNYNDNAYYGTVYFKVEKRTGPTLSAWDATGAVLSSGLTPTSKTVDVNMTGTGSTTVSIHYLADADY